MKPSPARLIKVWALLSDDTSQRIKRLSSLPQLTAMAWLLETIIRFFAFPNFIFIPSPLSVGCFQSCKIPHQLHRLLC
jgi:hypothetical protein